MASETDPLPTLARTRSAGFDSARGYAILAVIAIHVCGHFRHKVEPDSLFWYALVVPNRAFQFAVPTFILISAFFNGGNILKGYTLQRYASSRVRKVLWPYVVWSAVGIGVAASTTGPRLDQITISNLERWMLWGKAYYHLYFMVIVLQLFVVLPLLAPLVRRRPPLYVVLPSAALLQLAVYVLNRRLAHWEFAGSMVLWYVVPVLLGLWLAGQSERLKQIATCGWVASAVLTAASFGLFCPLQLAALRGEAVNTFVFQVVEWVYTASAGFLLIAGCVRFASEGGLSFIRGCGVQSLQIYLMHPFVILGLDVLLKPYGGLRTAYAVPLYYFVALLVSYSIARLLTALRLSPLLFGS